MGRKALEALLIGVGLWAVAAVVIVVFGGLPIFRLIAPPGVLLLVPVMYGLTRWHLRDVPPADRAGAGLRLGVLVTGVQFPLDLLAFLSIYEWGIPDLTQEAQQAIVFALLVGYSCLLFVPWWTAGRGRVSGRRRGLRSTRRSVRNPTLHLICGLPCSGKTTLAKRLEHERDALRLTPDELISCLLPEGWDRAELDRLRDPTEAVQWDLAARTLTLGVDVILDWGLWSRSDRDALRERAEALGARVRTHFCDASLEELRERVAARNDRLQPGEFEIEEAELEAWWRAFEPPTPEELATED